MLKLIPLMLRQSCNPKSSSLNVFHTILPHMFQSWKATSQAKSKGLDVNSEKNAYKTYSGSQQGSCMARRLNTARCLSQSLTCPLRVPQLSNNPEAASLWLALKARSNGHNDVRLHDNGKVLRQFLSLLLRGTHGSKRFHCHKAGDVSIWSAIWQSF